MDQPLIFRKKIIVFLGTSETLTFYQPLIEALNNADFLVYVANSNRDFFGLCEIIDAMVIVGDGRQFTDLVANYKGQLTKIMYIWTFVDPEIPQVRSVQYTPDLNQLKFEVAHLLGWN